jgi:hypothetical protein
VFVVMDAQDKTVVSLVRLMGMAFDEQLARLRSLDKAYNNAAILAEYNSMGGPLVERLQAEGLPVSSFVTTAASKHEIITALGLAFENGEIRILNDTVLVSELNAYEKKDRAGLPSYSAPVGMHDDTVMALALGWRMISVPLQIF